MNWYYVESGRRMGPVSESTLALLVRAGAVRGETLVWREGMADWQPYAAARKAVFAAAPEAGEVPEAGAAAGPAPGGVEAAATGLGACSLCGRILPRDRFAGEGESDVCADCRRTLARAFPEGAALPGTLVYGGFWRRFAAKIIDSLILSVPAVAVNFAAEAFVTAGGHLLAVGVQILVLLVNTAIGAVFTGLFLGKYGATPGKMALGLKVVTPEGGPIGYETGFGRYFAEILSGLTLGIGYLMAAFDERRRTLHDRICNTRVVRA